MAGKKTYILDTNVLIHDPESMHSFKGHEVVIPFEALEELDKLKKRFDQIGQNARHVIRNLGEFIDTGRIDRNNGGRETGEISIGSPVWLQELPADRKAVSSSTDNRIDNKITSLAWLYKQKHNGNTVFVSKDINARIKAKIFGIQTEDYENDKVDISTIYSAVRYDNRTEVVKGMFLDRGCPKSLYRPGSSTDILIFQKDRIVFAEDILINRYNNKAMSRYTLGFGEPMVETDVKVRSLIAFPRKNKKED